MTVTYATDMTVKPVCSSLTSFIMLNRDDVNPQAKCVFLVTYSGSEEDQIPGAYLRCYNF